jgi:hypothetical protein
VVGQKREIILASGWASQGAREKALGCEKARVPVGRGGGGLWGGRTSLLRRQLLGARLGRPLRPARRPIRRCVWARRRLDAGRGPGPRNHHAS